MVLKRFIFYTIACLSTLNALGQVTGRVIDSKTRQPLDYVNVYYDNTGIGEQTDENGRFVLKEDSALREIKVTSMGYVTQVIKLKAFGSNKNLQVRLVPEARLLEGVTVQAKKKKYSRKTILP